MDIEGPREMPPRVLAIPLDPSPLKTVDAANAAKPNHRKAVTAWASRQRFSVSWEPFVMWLWRV